jgi:hypothetical protein
MTNQVGGVRQAGPMMPRNTVKENRLVRRVAQKVRGQGKLFGRRARPAHRHDDPANPQLADDPLLLGELGIGGVDRGQRDDRPDPFLRDDSSQRRLTLPGSTYQLARYNDLDSFLEPMITERDHAGGQNQGNTQETPDAQLVDKPSIHPRTSS